MTKFKTLILVALTGFAFGRFMAPTRVETTKENTSVTAETTKTDTRTDTDRDRHREVTTTERVKPDGSRETITKTVEDTSTKRTTDTDRTDTGTTSTTSRETKVVERSSGQVAVSFLAGFKFSDPGPRYGLHVQRNILGPITAGAFGFASGEAGVSVGLSF